MITPRMIGKYFTSLSTCRRTSCDTITVLSLFQDLPNKQHSDPAPFALEPDFHSSSARPQNDSVGQMGSNWVFPAAQAAVPRWILTGGTLFHPYAAGCQAGQSCKD